MRWCWLCRFLTEVDDFALVIVNDYCICVRCYDRETAHVPAPMSPTLRRELIVVLGNV